MSTVFSLDRKSVIFGDNQELIWVWDADIRKRDSQPLGGHSESLSCLSFSSDGKYIASGSEDKTTTIWDMKERRGLVRSEDILGEIRQSNFLQLGMASSQDETILVWNAMRNYLYEYRTLSHILAQ